MLSVAYAANVGGTGFLTGSPPNLVLPQKLSDEWPDHPLTFLTWSLFSLPLMVCNLILAFVWLSIFDRLQGGGRSQPAQNAANDEVRLKSYGTNSREEELPNSNDDGDQKIKDIILQEYKSLGRWSVAEITVGLSFFVLLLLWLFKKPGGAQGWISLFPYDYVIHDATATILVVLIVFALPSGYYFWPFQPLSEEPRASEPLLEWSGERGVEKRLQWGVILLLGGGFALSEACTRSGRENIT